MRRRLRAAAAVLCLGMLGVSALPGELAGAAPPSPSLVAPAFLGNVTENPLLDWGPVPGATRYNVQVSTSASFTPTPSTISTYATSYAPPADLAVGPIFWRVQSVDGTGASAWSESQFVRRAATAPTPIQPLDNATLAYPDQAPLLGWLSLNGAKSYEVDVDDDPSFTSPQSFTTANTTLVLVDPLAVGQPWYWRVRGNSAGNVPTDWSVTRTFGFTWPVVPTLLAPTDTVAIPLEEVEVSWSAVPGASSYDLQVSPNGDFGGNLSVNVSVKSTRYAPPVELPAGAYYWRVRARTSTSPPGLGSWSTVRQFLREWPAPANNAFAAITLLTPANGDFAVEDLEFTWTPQRLAARYEIQVGEDSFFSGGTYNTCFTNQTSFTPKAGCGINPAPGDTYYWRVRAIDEPEPILGQWSLTSTFKWYPSIPTLLAPASGATTSAPVLEWTARPNVSAYQVTVLKANGTQALQESTHNIRYVPVGLVPTDGPFKWFIQSLDYLGRAGPVPSIGSARTFTLIEPASTSAEPTITGPPSGTRDRVPSLLTWSPTTAAKYYTVWYAPTGSNVYQLLVDNLTIPAYAHTGRSGPGMLSAGVEFSWYVQAFSPARQLISSSGGTATFRVDPLTPTTLLAPVHCVSGTNCLEEYDTPRFDWLPVTYAEGYEIHIATDINFTNEISLPSYTTHFSTFTPQESLPDSQAGQSYFWYARPCFKLSTPRHCGPFDATIFPSAFAFRKRSAPVKLLAPADNTTFANQITFTWEDYLVTHQGLARPGAQEAKHYRVEVSTTQDFANIVHTSPLVDETVYTAFSATFPEGQLYWRVQALDNSNNALTFSPIWSLVKNSPAPNLTLPVANATVTSSPTFRWDAQPFAARYEIEIYKNIDQALSSANKMFGTSAITTRVNGYAPTAALPPGLYGWRIRRLDADNRPGPWSAVDNNALRRFTSTGAAPELIAPVNGAVLPDSDILFSWNPSPGAATYRVEVSTSTDFSSTYDTTPASNTVMNSFAPTKQYADGTYYWRVRAIDGSSNIIGTSPVRSFAKDQSTLGEYFPLTPARIFDSRTTDSPVLTTTTRTVSVLGKGLVPTSGVSAVVMNVTVVSPTASSWLTVWPAGATKPVASNLNYNAGQVIPNLVVVKVGTGSTNGGKISLANNAGSTNVILDVVGWFGDGTNGRGARFQPTDVPARIFDSRSSTPIGSGLTRDIQVSGLGGVPNSASAVVMNVTVVSPTAAGWLTVFPQGVTKPEASNLNFTAGQVVPNLVVVKVGTNQSVSVFNSAGNTQVLMDVVGWYEDGNPGPGSRFNAMAPLRIVDTRSAPNAPALAAKETRYLAIRGVGGAAGVPANATSVVLNVTVTGPTGAGWLTLWPSGTLPTSSNVNYVAGQTVPNLVVVKLAADGGVNLFSQAPANVIFDVVGWYGG